MKLNITIVGRTRHKQIKIEGNKPHLDLHLVVDLATTATGKLYSQKVRCKVFYPLAKECLSLLSQGSMVAISGRPEINLYSLHDGRPRAELVVLAQKIQVLPDVKSDEDASARYWSGN